MTETVVTVTVKRWEHGWELHCREGDVTQVRSLAHADQQVRDYLDSVDPDTDHSELSISFVSE